MVRGVQELLDWLETDRSLDQPDRLRERLDALDRLDALVLDDASLPGAETASKKESSSADETLIRARLLYTRLEAINRELYQGIRLQIQQGRGRESLLPWLPDRAVGEGRIVSPVSGQGYDYLDELISGVLQIPAPEDASVKLAPEMVFYQPTPTRHIFDLIGQTRLVEKDVLIDLGSGLGHVPLLVSICTGARCIGVELQQAYIDCARHTAKELNLNSVTFLQQDVREADLSSGTVFYLYTPFTGSILRTVLDRLRTESAKREIRICTFGPCTPIIAEEPRLIASDGYEEDRIAVFRSGAVSPNFNEEQNQILRLTTPELKDVRGPVRSE